MSDWRRRWQRYRRQNRFLLSLSFVLLLLVGGGFWLFLRMEGLPPEELTNRLLTFLLWLLDLTLIAVLLFILLRNLIKLALDRRFGILGSRFRIKLLLSYLVLILVPTGFISLLSVLLLSRAASSWFTAPVEGMAQAGVQLAQATRRDAEERASRAAETIGREVLSLGSDPAKIAELERLHRLLGNHLTGWQREGVSVVELVDPRQRQLIRLPPLDNKLLASDGARSDRFGGTVVVRGWRRLPQGSVIIVGEALPSDLVQSQERLAVGGASYESLKIQRPVVTATTILGFGGLALLVVFSAIWLGLYLARRFTTPLMGLAAITQRIAEGDSLEQVPVPGEDEVGLLVNSFNAMVRKLRDREEELRSTVSRLDTVLGAVRTGVLTLDAERKSILGNPAAAALLGVPDLAIRSRTLDELTGIGLDKLVEVLRAASSATRLSLTIYPQTVARHVEVAVAPLGEEDAMQGWVVAVEDLTQLLRAQRQAAWSEVARRIAHQIKNPLTPIRLAAERIARKFAKGAPDLAQVVPQGCEAIVVHVQAMQEMVDAFSSYAKFPPMARRPVVLAELATHVVNLYQGVRENIVVQLEDNSSGQEVIIDPEHFRHALTNLLDNAIEASSPGDKVTLSLALEGDEIVIEVRDQGHGLHGDDAELLFQPFYSTKGRGSGVGLAIVLRVVTDHGGVVRLEPNQPRGVRAIIRIPGH